MQVLHCTYCYAEIGAAAHVSLASPVISRTFFFFYPSPVFFHPHYHTAGTGGPFGGGGTDPG